MSLLCEAIDFAIEAHKGKVRRFSNTAYIQHPLAVMGILTEFYDSEEVLAAAVLHDTVEDCEDITLEVIHERFAETVAGIVFYVTEISQKSDGNRAVRKAIDLRHYAAGPPESQDLKCADIIHNVPSIVQFDPEFAWVYLKEKEQLLNALEKCNPILKTRTYTLLYNMYNFLRG